MSPAGHDDVRAAAALLAIAASGGHRDRPAALGAILGTDAGGGDAPTACIAWTLAAWLAQVLRDGGTDPRWFALQVIAESIADEATQGAEGTP
jgi:hypothetical protein